MERCELLAFLLCEKATAGSEGKVTLHGLFDRIIVLGKPTSSRLFFVYYKVIVKEPCVLSLRVTDSSGREIPGNWRDPLPQIGPMHAVWSLASGLFERPGPYVLELRQESDGEEKVSLASTAFVVEQRGE